jgi:fatty-acyl-CoA synthase
MKNSAAFIEIAFAVSHVGAVLVPVNFRLAPDEVDYILEDSAAVLFFRDEELASWTPVVPATIHLSPEMQLDTHSPGSASDDAMAPVGESDLMRIMYTSGTTDRPKGVMHTYRNFYAKSSDQIIDLGLTSNTRLLVCGPLYHVGAFDLPGIAVLWAGGMLCIQRDYNPERALDLIERERLTGAWLAPVMAGELLASQKAQPRDASSLEWIIGGGERTPESRIRLLFAASPMLAT